jgi:hypothetical protein
MIAGYEVSMVCEGGVLGAVLVTLIPRLAVVGECGTCCSDGVAAEATISA